MDDIRGAFAQKIGIYYKDDEWANEILNKISNIYEGCIQSITTFFGGYSIVLKDNTYIKILRATPSARGYRWSKVIIQDGIPIRDIETLILPKVIYTGRDYSRYYIDENGHLLCSIEYRQRILERETFNEVKDLNDERRCLIGDINLLIEK